MNPTIIPEAIAGNQEAAVNPSSHTQLVGFQNPEDDHLAKEASCNMSAHQQGVKRKADTPLGSPLEPGQILEKNEDSSKVKLKIRFSSSQDEEEIDMDTVHDSQAFISHHLNMLERPSTPGLSKYRPANSRSALIPQHSAGCDGTPTTKPQWNMELPRKGTGKEQPPLEMSVHAAAAAPLSVFGKEPASSKHSEHHHHHHHEHKKKKKKHKHKHKHKHRRDGRERGRGRSPSPAPPAAGPRAPRPCQTEPGRGTGPCVQSSIQNQHFVSWEHDRKKEEVTKF